MPIMLNKLQSSSLSIPSDGTKSIPVFNYVHQYIDSIAPSKGISPEDVQFLKDYSRLGTNNLENGFKLKPGVGIFRDSFERFTKLIEQYVRDDYNNGTYGALRLCELQENLSKKFNQTATNNLVQTQSGVSSVFNLGKDTSRRIGGILAGSPADVGYSRGYLDNTGSQEVPVFLAPLKDLKQETRQMEKSGALTSPMGDYIDPDGRYASSIFKCNTFK